MAYYNQSQQAPQTEHELGWDDSFDGTLEEWKPLPEGDYPFRVESFQRARYNPKPGAKLPPCNMAELTIRVFGEEEATIKHNLYLHTSRRNSLKHFFVSIGQAQEADTLVQPRWNEVPGAEGMCHVVVDSYTRRDGTPGQSNKISRFLPPDAGADRPQTQGQTNTQAASRTWQQASGSGWRQPEQQTIGGYPQGNPGHWNQRGF